MKYVKSNSGFKSDGSYLLDEAWPTENSISPSSLKKPAQIVKETLIDGAPSREWWSRQSDQLANRFADEMRKGIQRKESLSDLIRRVRGTREKGFTDGIMTAPYARAEALVRTSVHAVANATYLNRYENDPEVAAIMWSAILEARTCPICIALDRKVWALPHYVPVGHDKEFPGTSAHWSCRCWQTALSKGKSGDAVLPTTMTYEQWLNKRPEDEQKEILGKGKFALWKKGLIRASDLTDQSNNPISLAELEAKYL